MQGARSPIFDLNPQFVLAVGRAAPEGLRLLGSAFLVAPGRLITTKHVTGGDETNLVVVAPRIRTLLDYEDTSDTSVRLAKARITGVDTFRDICILEISGAASPPYCDDSRYADRHQLLQHLGAGKAFFVGAMAAAMAPHLGAAAALLAPAIALILQTVSRMGTRASCEARAQIRSASSAPTSPTPEPSSETA